MAPTPYKPQNPIRIVSAASLFDGHDAAINVMRRILQSSGAEVIHLGHNRSVAEIVECAIEEDAQAIAITSYQGGHIEYFKYMYDLLQERGAKTKIFGGGGGTILPEEAEELHAYGIARIYSPDDGREMGLQGMINHLLESCDFPMVEPPLNGAGPPSKENQVAEKDPQAIARLISLVENHPETVGDVQSMLASVGNGLDASEKQRAPVLGITGTGGSGKSSLVDELVRRYLLDFPDKTAAVISVDPSRRKSGGALLGDRIRMNSIHHPRVYMRSLATRQSNLAMSKYVAQAVEIVQAAGYDLVILETSGIGQSDTEIVEHSDLSLYVMTSEYGAATQLEKIDMLDFADVIAINKFDKKGSLDALRDVRKQYRRNHNQFDGDDGELPIYGTVASQFNDGGTNRLYKALMAALAEKAGAAFASDLDLPLEDEVDPPIVPPARVRYLAEIAEDNRAYSRHVEEQCSIARQAYRLYGAIAALRDGEAGDGETGSGEGDDWAPELTASDSDSAAVQELVENYNRTLQQLDLECRDALTSWPAKRERFSAEKFTYEVRGKQIERDLHRESLSHLKIPRVALPKYHDWGEVLRWLLTENVPGEFPYAAGVFPLKRQGEDPTRMFAGEGGPERTNRRFHYVSLEEPAKRLSTAFDSVTLYGEDPGHRPDIYGKVGNSGVSVASLDDAKRLYSGFNLIDPATSVSMTINGPAPMLLGFFLNTAVDQQCEAYLREQGKVDEVAAQLDRSYADQDMVRPAYRGEIPQGHDGSGLLLLGASGDRVLDAETYGRIREETLSKVRGTVQADILKEDQAQNTCIFSTEFALRMMGDVQQYFIDHGVRNFYSVSISGYHIAEAGANPISQLAFTLANGFTYVEYYLSRGMDIDAFAPNLSFFFSNGMDPEYSVMGRVARRIWAKAIRRKYGGNARSQKLKYHIQTSGRSLHAQEISFNDIRTTLQALYAIYDNCNSLHTNAYDEAITTPTEESVRRAQAIQLIINRELGLAKNENPLQGAFIIDELTDLVEEAVLAEFESLSDRGGVLGAMERMYQRTKIQEESLYYETLKHTGELPVVGVNTFLSSEGSPTVTPGEVIRATQEEKEDAIAARDAIHLRNAGATSAALADLQRAAVTGGNVFASLMEVTKVATLGQITHALYEVGGQYRRNM